MATATKGSRNGKVAQTETAPETDAPMISLRPIRTQTIIVPITGVTPVIPHRWSEKALRMMRDKQIGDKARPKRDAKVPEQEAEASTYYLPDGKTPGIPATAFKAAIVGAVRLFEGITLVTAKQSVFVEGVGPEQLVAISGERTLREDTPRNANGGADLRYRFAYYPWTAELTVTYTATVLDLNSIIALVSAAGTGGVGDWRPSAPKSLTGSFGRFEVDANREVKILG